MDFNLASLVVPDVDGGGRDVVESMNRVCDYTGGDLYGDIYNQSFTCKYYKNITKNQPFEFMTGRCKPSLSEHTTNKSLEELKLELMLTVCSHHGAAFVIDAIDPSGAMDQRVYQEIGEAFEAIRPYESYFKGRMIEDIGVYYSCTSRFNPDGQKFSNHSCAIGLTKTLIQNHVPVGILGNDGMQALTHYKMVFAPNLTAIPDQNAEALIRYVKNGGRLYFSGVQEKLLLEFFGAKQLGLTESDVTYIAPKEKAGKLFGGYNGKYPMHIGFRLPLVGGISEEDVIASITLPYTCLLYTSSSSSMGSVREGRSKIFTGPYFVTVSPCASRDCT